MVVVVVVVWRHSQTVRLLFSQVSHRKLQERLVVDLHSNLRGCWWQRRPWNSFGWVEMSNFARSPRPFQIAFKFISLKVHYCWKAIINKTHRGTGKKFDGIISFARLLFRAYPSTAPASACVFDKCPKATILSYALLIDFVRKCFLWIFAAKLG